MSKLTQELQGVLNRHCAENGSNTPDFILAEYLLHCLGAFNNAVNRREVWYGRVWSGEQPLEPPQGEPE